MCNKLFFFLCVSVILVTSYSFADTVALNTGVTVEGKIISKTQYDVTVELEDGDQVSYMMSDVESINNHRVINPDALSDGSTDSADSVQAGTMDIPINPLMSFNGMNRDEIIALRQQNIQQISSLAPKDYQPNMNVFGQIQDGKPWWGVLGYYYYGPGKQSIEGDSYYSQFILNPYLLVGITTNSYVVHDSSLTAKDLTPMPLKLVWEQKGLWGQATYSLSDFNQESQDYHLASSGTLNLELINARDFGFNYFSIDSTQSKGIKASTDQIIPLIQFIHTGGSCGYPGGCNNRSPSQDVLHFDVTDLPARVYLKLWKKQVSDPSQKEDMVFIIDLK